MTGREIWLDDVTHALERRIAATGATPDFLDVVVRAHELDPAAMPAERIDEADALMSGLDASVEPELGPTVPGALPRGHEVREGARGDARRTARQEDGLDDWLGDVRAAVERRVDQARAQPRPPLPVRRDRRVAWWIGGVALAAAILLVVGIGQVVRVAALGTAEAPDQAFRTHERSGTTGTVQAPERDAPRPRLRTPPPTKVEHEVVVVPEPEPAAEPEPSDPSASRTKRRMTKAQRLKALADQAQAHWRAGRRDEARRLFERVVAEGGRSRAAEMAYADLFTLASQAGDTATQRKRWRAYLRRFPRGRFADDARAGLCRSAAAAKRQACWTDYLEDFPRGSFRAEARAGGGDR